MSSQVVNSGRGTTPEPDVGHNRRLREISRLLLGLTALSLFSNANGIATIASACAILVMRDGTFFSIKNIKWAFLSITSFLFSLTAYCLGTTGRTIIGDDVHDHDDSAGVTFLRMIYLSGMKFFQLFWGTVLTLVLVSAYTSKAQEQSNTIKKLQPAKPE